MNDSRKLGPQDIMVFVIAAFALVLFIAVMFRVAPFATVDPNRPCPICGCPMNNRIDP